MTQTSIMSALVLDSYTSINWIWNAPSTEIKKVYSLLTLIRSMPI